MGSCIFKQVTDNESVIENIDNDHTLLSSDFPTTSIYNRKNKSLAETIDKLVIETLEVIGTIVDNEAQLPTSISMLHVITDKPAGWIELVQSLMRVVPVEHPMGPSVIALLLDDSPLPSRESVLKVAELVSQINDQDSQQERNLCVILGCLAEKLAGPNSSALLQESTLTYLLGNLNIKKDKNVQLLSIIAIEKFSKTSENKNTIKKLLTEFEDNPLLKLEHYASNNDFLLRQIGFCARWCLDNYFPVKNRKYSYETIDVSNIKAMLNTKDVSEYLKISPDGLEARCDAYTFESVRCTFQVSSGCWYYEVELITPGIMQIGWATKDSKFLSDDGYGIGDDKYSIGFDGCRRLVWHNAKSTPHNLPAWKSHSILGCLLDLEKYEVIFTLNGKATDPYRHVCTNVKTGFFAAASFMSFQQCRFNFGVEDFCFPPKKAFNNFNTHGVLDINEKIVLPRHIYIQNLQAIKVGDDCCTLCYDRRAIIRLEPCQHRGFCIVCVRQLTFCPMCRVKITANIQEHTEHNADAQLSYHGDLK